MSYGGFKLPRGFRFQPSDEDLLSHFLQLKNQRKDPKITAIIPEIDVCKHEPRDLPALVFTSADLDREWFPMADSPEMEWYFFSPRDFKYSNSKVKSNSTKINRTTKEGSWKKQGKDRRITEACSDKQIGGKRILTFYLPERQKTDWIIHEYYLTKADSDEQIGDFVLCRLKDNRSKKKSGKSDHDRQDAPIELGNGVLSPNGNDDATEDGGSCSSMALNVETPASNSLADDPLMPLGDHDGTEHDGGGSCHFASDMLTEAEENSVFQMLQDILFEPDDNDQELRGSQTGPCNIDESDLSIPVEGQPDGYNSPDSEMVGKLLPHPSLSPELQSPIYTNSFPDDECRKRKYPFGDSYPSLTKKNHTDEDDSNTSSYSENQADELILEGYSQLGGNLGSDLFGSHNLLPINREPRDLPNNWDGLPPIMDGFESFLGNSDTLIDGGISDINSEVASGSVNNYFAFDIGATLQGSDILLTMVQRSPGYMK